MLREKRLWEGCARLMEMNSGMSTECGLTELQARSRGSPEFCDAAKVASAGLAVLGNETGCRSDIDAAWFGSVALKATPMSRSYYDQVLIPKLLLP